ncbi:hypothetical protein [Reichenbachiella ulvae]|uniref:Cytochrome c domain-containing protein n=1 Tax=Reichenbachiella ulvae TaxID=2980104 RepID=A0ABT3CSH3_9BACT|nr:hypothetical protein [Reichenbachiella ulvae]MCV9386567.1 hypothetical protein [Reichenbachiella ulvae]
MKRLLIIIGICGLLSSCANDSEEELAEMQQAVDEENNGGNGSDGGGQNPTTEVSLSTDVVPILDGNCAVSGCHVTGRTSPDLSVKSNIISNASSIKSEVVSGRMPRGGSLSNTEIGLISDWVDQGAKDN